MAKLKSSRKPANKPSAEAIRSGVNMMDMVMKPMKGMPRKGMKGGK